MVTQAKVYDGIISLTTYCTQSQILVLGYYCRIQVLIANHMPYARKYHDCSVMSFDMLERGVIDINTLLTG